MDRLFDCFNSVCLVKGQFVFSVLFVENHVIDL